jgi:hypothetical protein
MRSADDLLEALKAKGVTHAAIAKVLGVTTNNATMLYNPAKKTGKPRRLTYDEAVKLVEAFDLEEQSASDAVLPPLSVPVARLVVLYALSKAGVDPDPHAVEELARDIQAFSQFAAQPRMRDSESLVEGFFAGLEHQKARAVRG